METKELDLIAQYLLEDCALCFAGRRKAALRHQLEERVARLDLAGLGSYLHLLRNSPQERSALYQLITVNETSFFRNRQQFEDLRISLIPRLEQIKGRRLTGEAGEGSQVSPASLRKLRILSAGCSTGEEPYSLAMTLLEALRYPLAWELEIVAGDLSEECLQVGARGHYSEGKVRGLPAGYRDRYLCREGAGWSVSPELKALVRFQQLNLSRIMKGERLPGLPGDFPGFDVIFCRNVMIYFPPDSQQLLIETLQRLLAPDGYLFTGDAEPLHLYRHDLERVDEVASLIYRKKAPSTSASPAAGAEQLSGNRLQQVPSLMPSSKVTPQGGASPLAMPAAEGGPLSDCAVEELLLMVADSSLGCREKALQRLMLLGLRSLSPILDAAVRNDGNAGLRNGAMDLLVRFGEAAVPMLTTLLRDPNEEVRNFSTVMLGSIGSGSSLTALIAALEDADPNVRHGAAEALGKIGDERAAEPLLKLLDQGFWLQFPAVSALGQLGSPAAVPRLLDLLEDEILFEPALRALQAIGDSRAVPVLERITRGAAPHRGRAAAKAIEAIKGKRNAGFSVTETGR